MKVKDIQVSLVCPICKELRGYTCIDAGKYELLTTYTFECVSCGEQFLLTLGISNREKEDEYNV